MLLSTSGGVCHRDLEISHRPDGKTADTLASTLLHNCGGRSGQLYSVVPVVYVPQRPEISHRPMGKLLTCLRRLTLAQLQTLWSTIQGVRATETLQTSHRPNWRIADVLAPIHACTTANASVNYRPYVPQRPCKLPIAPMEKLLTC
jgi:hypothetical protein